MHTSIPSLFRVIDLKQHTYCPRVFYYHTALPAIRPLTDKMRSGIRAHEKTEALEKRRSLKAYGVQTGERQFNLRLHDSDLHLSGEIDMVITTPNERIPVDFKHSRRDGPHFRLQLMAYGRLLEKTADPDALPVRRGFLYLIPQRKAVEVKFTKPLRRKLDLALEEMQRISTAQWMPPPTPNVARCVDCEFRRFCNDVL